MLKIFIKQRLKLVLLLCFFSLTYSYFLQYIAKMNPCVLCIVERYCFITLFAVTALEILLKNLKVLVLGLFASLSLRITSCFISISGLVICYHHYQLQNKLNGDFISCGMPLEIYYQQNSFLQFLKYLLYENVECAKSVVLLFGVNIILLEVLLFTVILSLTLLDFLRKYR